MRRRFVLTALSVAVVQAFTAIAALAEAMALGDAREPVPPWLGVFTRVAGFPALPLSDVLAHVLDDLWALGVGYALGGLAWGCLVAGALTLRRRRRMSAG